MIGRLANAKFVYHYMLHRGHVFTCKLAAAFRRTDEVIDASKMGKGEVDLARVEKLLADFGPALAPGSSPSRSVPGLSSRLRVGSCVSRFWWRGPVSRAETWGVWLPSLSPGPEPFGAGAYLGVSVSPRADGGS
jgi:hypothetical protein